MSPSRACGGVPGRPQDVHESLDPRRGIGWWGRGTLWLLGGGSREGGRKDARSARRLEAVIVGLRRVFVDLECCPSWLILWQ